MKIHLEFNQYTFNYNSSITVGTNQLKTNDVLNVRGELLDPLDLISLPGFHLYSLNQWKFSIESFFKDQEFDFSDINLEVPFFNTIKKSPETEFITDDLLFAIESVLFKVIERNFPDKLFFLKESPLNIKINALYHQDSEFNLTAIECLKIKIRPTENSLQQTIALINKGIVENPKIKFRLDGNRTFELVELATFVNQLHLSSTSNFLKQIEYFEEPFKNFYDSFSFQKQFNYNLGVDETVLLYQHQLENLDQLPVHCTLILKPTLLGISKTFEIMKFAQFHNLKTVISSTYDSESCIKILYQIASLSKDICHGLDTSKFLPKL